MKHALLIDAERAVAARDWNDGIIVDNFAGGGGASTGIERALSVTVDVAVNHDPEAVAMHAANHPTTRHLCQSVWAVDPLEAVTFANDNGEMRPRPVRLAWFSPDCKHFSKAKGGEFAVVTPYFTPLTHHGKADRNYAPGEPIPTITGAHRGEIALITPHVMTMRNSGKPHTAANEPTHTVTAGGAHQYLVAAFMAQHNTMPRGGLHAGHSAQTPVSTITARGTQQGVVASHLVKLRNNCVGQGNVEPIGTITSGGGHFGEVRAFLVKYYGNEQDGHGLGGPLGAVTTRDRFGLVTVTIEGEDYVIVDIGMRMLSPRELFAAQGFPPDYIIELEVNGRPLTKTAQVRMCGNSVSPVMSEALARANVANDNGAQRIAA